MYDLLSVCRCNYSSILYRFRDKAIYWLTIAIFSYPCSRRPRFGGGVAVGLSLYCLVWKN